METVLIKKVESVSSQRTGKRFFYVHLDDGRKATTFDIKISEMSGFTVMADIVQNGNFTNIKVIKVLARPNGSENAMATPSSSNERHIQDISTVDKEDNPIFPFLGACSMASALLLHSFSEGNNIEESIKYLKENFGSLVTASTDLYKNHMTVTEMKETAEKLME
ncbi:MAG: hypothetical protein PHW15_02760 [Patescibacteria group bacterium]|nr:hypothetical protein [Patescibacteria group bacterium]